MAALVLDTDVSAIVTGVRFRKNTIGLWMEGGALSSPHSTFKSNNSLTTGAAVFRDGNGGDVTIDSTLFKKNRSACARRQFTAQLTTARRSLYYKQPIHQEHVEWSRVSGRGNLYARPNHHYRKSLYQKHSHYGHQSRRRDLSDRERAGY